MISTSRRLFKGYNGYDELKRLQFDLETQGLNPEIHAIDQIGIRTNKGFEKIITVTGEGEERKLNELRAIIEFVQILRDEKPDVIAGHNSENFDWNFIIVRCQQLGTSLEEISLQFFKHPIFKKNKESVIVAADYASGLTVTENYLAYISVDGYKYLINLENPRERTLLK